MPTKLVLMEARVTQLRNSVYVLKRKLIRVIDQIYLKVAVTLCP